MKVPQDLHIHTVYSTGDSSVVREQTIGFIAKLRHAERTGISDHFEYLLNGVFDRYEKEIREKGFNVGMEICAPEYIGEALTMNGDYYVYHCRDTRRDYRSLEKLLTTGKPVIVAHPFMMGTDLAKVPVECYIEVNNRYIWRGDWKKNLTPWVDEKKFVISSDAHQPNWLNQNVARYVCSTLGIAESLLFE